MSHPMSAAPCTVRASIAHALLHGMRPVPANTAPTIESVGEITLQPHQRDALPQLLTLLRSHGGALLADDVGMGKTFTALAVAAHYAHCDIIAPATLLPMWRLALTRTNYTGTATVTSWHQFSHTQGRNPPPIISAPNHTPRLVILDEAHALRHHNTQRFPAIARFTRGAHCLLLSATPVVNRTRDLAQLLSLALGARAFDLTTDDLRTLVVRRSHDPNIPIVTSHPPITIPDSPPIVRAIRTLPPPLPLYIGTHTATLIRLGLLRAWSSSAAACSAFVQRRITRAAALETMLADHHWPNARELLRWCVADDTLQLSLTALLTTHSAPPPPIPWDDARTQLHAHTAALRQLKALLHTAGTSIDRARADALIALRAQHPDDSIVAFSQYAATIHGLWTTLVKHNAHTRAAALTATHARIASGRITRRELLHHFAPHAHGVPPPPHHARITLLLTTDLLAEGVNLQDAAVIVHLDAPWTVTTLTQREGRIARLGSPHRVVHAHAMGIPHTTERALQLQQRLITKAHSAASALRGTPPAPTHTPLSDTPRLARTLLQFPPAVHRMLQQWLTDGTQNIGCTCSPHATGAPRLCYAPGSRAAWIATSTDSHPIIAGYFTKAGTTRVRTDPRTLTTILHGIVTRDVCQPVPPSETQLFLAAIERAIAQHMQMRYAHTIASPSRTIIPRIRARIQHRVAALSLSQRNACLPLATRALHVLDQLRGAGDETALAQLGQSPPPDITAWLTAIAALAPHATSPHTHTTPDRSAPLPPLEHPVPPTLHTVLLLLPASPR